MQADITAVGGAKWKLDFTPADKTWYVKCPDCQTMYRWQANYLTYPDQDSVEKALTSEEIVAAQLMGDFSVRRCRLCLKKALVKKYFRQD